MPQVPKSLKLAVEYVSLVLKPVTEAGYKVGAFFTTQLLNLGNAMIDINEVDPQLRVLAHNALAMFNLNPVGGDDPVAQQAAENPAP